MSNFTVDMTNIESPFGVIPDGEHRTRITGADLKLSKAKNQYINVEFTLADKQKIWDVLVLSGSDDAVNFGKWKLKNLLEACGITIEASMRNPHETLLGQYVNILVAPDRQDPTRKRVASYAPVTQGDSPDIQFQKTASSTFTTDDIPF